MFKVRITELATADIEDAFAWWSEHRSPEQAKRWYEEIGIAIATLKQMPERCPIVPETKLSISGVRQLLFGIGDHPTHRIIFVVESDAVVILRVRHHAQDMLGSTDLEG